MIARETSDAPWLLLAVWFGCIAGILEGVGLLVLQSLGVATWDSLLFSVDARILWIAPLTNTIICLATIALWRAASVVSAATRRDIVGHVLLSVIAAYALTSVPGRLRESALVLLAGGIGTAVARFLASRAPQFVHFAVRSTPVLVLCGAVAAVATRLAPQQMEALELGGSPAAAHDQPDVILIVLDTVRADRVSAYGHERPTTPFLERLAAKGVLFDAAFSSSSWTLPAHATLFTGRLPHEHGASLWPYDGRFPTLAEQFRERGYATAAVVANDTLCTAAFGLARGFIHWENIFTGVFDSWSRTIYGRRVYRQYLRHFERPGEPGRMTAREVRRRFEAWLAQAPERPVFAFLNFMDAHDRIRPPFEYRARFDPTAVPYHWTDWFTPLRQPTNSENVARPNLNVRYDAAIAFIDDELRQLFQTIERQRKGRGLIAVVTADHGESLGERGLYGHRSALYLGQIRVPLLVYAPGRVLPGVKVTSVVGLDAVPRMITTLATTDPASPDRGLELLERTLPADGAAISELDRIPYHANPSWPSHAGRIDSIIADEWHYVEHEKRGAELFNWRRDPTESNDLMSTPDGPGVAADLRARLRRSVGRAEEQERTVRGSGAAGQ